MPANAGVRSRVRAWLPVIVVVGVAAIAGVVAIPLGGWDTVQLQSAVIPEQPVGEPYVGHRLSTSIDDAYLTDASPDGHSEADPGQTFLVVEATMEAVRTEPEFPLGDTDFYAFTIPGVLELGTPIPILDYSTVLKRDGTFGPSLIPGVPDTVVFVFTVPVTAFAGGDVVHIGVTDASPEKANLFSGTRWVKPHVAVEVSITVRDER
ncbi:MAG: hypothetical protein ABI435_01405 [Pseudolysinimonas sp.]